MTKVSGPSSPEDGKRDGKRDGKLTSSRSQPRQALTPQPSPLCSPPCPCSLQSLDCLQITKPLSLALLLHGITPCSPSFFIYRKQQTPKTSQDGLRSREDDSCSEPTDTLRTEPRCVPGPGLSTGEPAGSCPEPLPSGSRWSRGEQSRKPST